MGRLGFATVAAVVTMLGASVVSGVSGSIATATPTTTVFGATVAVTDRKALSVPASQAASPGRIAGPHSASVHRGRRSGLDSRPGTVRSRISTQDVLNAIHIALHSGDITNSSSEMAKGPNGQMYYLHRVLPTSASLYPSAGAFTTDCSNPFAASYQYYRVSQGAFAYKECSSFLAIHAELKIGHDQFLHELDSLGKRIREAVGLRTWQGTSGVFGDRRRVTARFVCPKRYAKPPPGGSHRVVGVATVVLLEEAGQNGRTSRVAEAAVTKC